MDLLLRRRVPVVGIEGSHEPGVRLVAIDDRAASADLARLLAGLGHTSVAVVAMP